MVLYLWASCLCTPGAALTPGPTLGRAQDLLLYISLTTREPPSDFLECSSFRACSHLEMASQSLKRQRQKSEKHLVRGMRSGQGWPRAEQQGRVTVLHGEDGPQGQDPRCLCSSQTWHEQQSRASPTGLNI